MPSVSQLNFGRSAAVRPGCWKVSASASSSAAGARTAMFLNLGESLSWERGRAQVAVRTEHSEVPTAEVTRAPN